jgi:hypothetical protein
MNELALILQNDQLVSAAVGALMPVAVDFVRAKFNITNSRVAFILTIASSLVAGLCITIAANDLQLDFQTILANLTLIFTASQVVYNQYWETSENREKLLTKAS